VAKKKIKCENCGRDVWVNLVKVYVFKLRYCPEKGCKGEMFSDNELKIHKCKKCGFEVKFDDEKSLGSMGVAMKGTSRSKKVSEVMSREGYEVEKVLIPEKHYCQRCINMNKIIANMIRKETKKRDLRKLSKEEANEVIRKAVLRRLREQHQKEVAKRDKEMKREAELRKPKKGPKELLTTPFNVVISDKKKKRNVDLKVLKVRLDSLLKMPKGQRSEKMIEKLRKEITELERKKK